MTSSIRLPTVWPVRPLSQPGMTWLGLLPMTKLNGWPRFQEASNTVPFPLPLRHSAPTYCTTTVWLALTAGPLPLTRTLVTSLAGGLPDGTLIFGAAPAAAVALGSAPPPLGTCSPVADAVPAQLLIRSATQTSV